MKFCSQSFQWTHLIKPTFALLLLGVYIPAIAQDRNTTFRVQPGVNRTWNRESRFASANGRLRERIDVARTEWFRDNAILRISPSSWLASPAIPTLLDPVNSSTGYISQGNPWSTADSAFFPNGITTAGATNWIYGSTTFIGNAPSNGFGHQFEASNGSSRALLAIGGGNVGIGTTNPQAPLSIFKAGAGVAQIHLYNNDNSSQRYSEIRAQFYPTDSSFTSGIRFLKEATGSNYGSGIGFVTEVDQATQSIDYAMYIKNRNVGIGTTAPGYPLHVSRSAADQYLGWFENTQSSPGLARLRVQNTATQGSFEIDVSTDGNTIFQTGKSANSPTLSILSGNVGIGTTSPYTKLQIAGGDISIDADHAIRKAGDNSIIAYSSSLPGIAIGSGTTTDQVIINAGGYERARILTNGNVGIGRNDPSYKLDVSGDTRITGNINLTGTINAKYQDVAEWVPSSEKLSAGTVVVLDSTKSNQVTSSSISYDTRVAGVVSEQPGIALGEKSDGKVLVATTGRVRVKVDATKSPIHIGDLLVTSDVFGMAMKSEPIMIGGRQIHAPGTLIGKALEPLEKGKATILVLLSLQ
jgi:hypothetical protein